MAATRSTFLGSIFRTVKARVLIPPITRLSLPNPNFTSSRFHTSSSLPQSQIEGSISSSLLQDLSIIHGVIAIASTSQGRLASVSMCTQYSTSVPTRSLRRRISSRKKSSTKPILNESKFQETISKLPPRFTPEELADAITLEEDPFLCFHLFNWASQQPRFTHENCSYHIAIRKLGAAKSGKLIRAVNIFRHMVNSRNLECRPTMRTYHILFKALLGRGNNSFINHLYMETVRSLFRQMVDSGIEPDVFALNCLVKGRTINTRELLSEMKGKGFVPNGKSYNSLVNAFALSGEIDDAVKCLWEMIENGRVVDFISYRTLVDESCRKGKYDEATRLLEMLREKQLVDIDSDDKLKMYQMVILVLLFSSMLPSVCDESRYMIVRNVPALGCGDDLMRLFMTYGEVEECKPMDAEDCAEFTDVYWIKFRLITNARKLDESSFLGNRLQISYAPEYESVSDTKEKLETRRKEVLARLNPHKAKSTSQVTKLAGPALTQTDNFSPRRREMDYQFHRGNAPVTRVSSYQEYFASSSMNQMVKTVREKLNKIEESGNQKRLQPSSQTQPDFKRTRVDNRRRI
ncbi:pentatricopeptide (PPR) repeat-containing protein [Arabidopsis thaliana]|uniref:RNA-binding protein 48 n=1 Tax=Arabidopsis thaliana TaxID=3702 RepID=F4K2V9_ARATH|nr:pentatricopeptide (PPR) repeat-containing protein [Arabidopsis thaliana]AED93669.1 pentatricopeptide (PPR) repeat-containing protein [Arabidopsis thaliana]|eukprot:NP_198082.4 pentatricopeptide (PPR) repeat-containing protein [Arabidopsis thaliana]